MMDRFSLLLSRLLLVFGFSIFDHDLSFVDLFAFILLELHWYPGCIN